MSPHLQRGQMLLSQGRSELAVDELRRALVDDPNDPVAHALLALGLLEQDNLQDATHEAGQAIHLAPDDSFSHYVMAQVLYHRNDFNAALDAAHTAIDLNPWDAGHFAMVSAIHLEQKHWPDALNAAQQGLEVEADHTRCVNLQALALNQLGRADEAEQSIGVALQKDPDNAFSHANQGWTRLHQGRPHEALVHFRDALRIEPGLGFAQSGIVEAMKARNPIYRWLLSWFLFLSRLSSRTQMFLALGLVFGQRIITEVAASIPPLAPFAPLIVLAYMAFVWMTWCGPMLFNLILRLDTFGRHALSTKERHQSSIVGVYLLIASGWCVAAAVTRQPALLIFAAPFALALIPLNAVFAAPNPVLFWIMVAVTACATWFAVVACLPSVEGANAIVTSMLISVYSTWASLFFIGSSQPKKI